MTLSPKLGVVEISTLWHFRLPVANTDVYKGVSSLSDSPISSAEDAEDCGAKFTSRD